MATAWLQLQGRSSSSLQALNTVIEIKIPRRPGSSWKGECTARGCFCSRAQSHDGSWCGVWSQPSGGRARQGGHGTAPAPTTQLLLLPVALATLGMVYSSTTYNKARHCDSQCPAAPDPTSVSSAEELMLHKPMSHCYQVVRESPIRPQCEHRGMDDSSKSAADLNHTVP